MLRLLNGVCLATLAPTTQTLIANLTPAHERGRAFSWSGFSMAMGCMTTAISTTTISQMRIFGLQGWRVAFAAVGLLSMVLGYFVKKWVKVPGDSSDCSAPSPSRLGRKAQRPCGARYDGGISFTKELKTVLSFFEARFC